jgi:hypothetical protein
VDLSRFIVDSEGQPVIGRYMKAPPIIAQLMRFPKRQVSAFLIMLHRFQKGDLNPKFADDPSIKLGTIIPLDKPSQSFVTDGGDAHFNVSTIRFAKCQ